MSERRVGTISRGIRGPVIREGDDLAGIVTESRTFNTPKPPKSVLPIKLQLNDK